MTVSDHSVSRKSSVLAGIAWRRPFRSQSVSEETDKYGKHRDREMELLAPSSKKEKLGQRSGAVKANGRART